MLSMSHILILLLVVVLVFGTSKLRNIGSDLGAAVRNFKKAMNDGENEAASGSDKDVTQKLPTQDIDKKDGK